MVEKDARKITLSSNSIDPLSIIYHLRLNLFVKDKRNGLAFVFHMSYHTHGELFTVHHPHSHKATGSFKNAKDTLAFFTLK